MNKHYCVSIHLLGDITHVENNIDMIIASIDYVGLDECFIDVNDIGMAVEEGVADDA